MRAHAVPEHVYILRPRPLRMIPQVLHQLSDAFGAKIRTPWELRETRLAYQRTVIHDYNIVIASREIRWNPIVVVLLAILIQRLFSTVLFSVAFLISFILCISTVLQRWFNVNFIYESRIAIFFNYLFLKTILSFSVLHIFSHVLFINYCI